MQSIMKTYLLISDRHFCYIVFIKRRNTSMMCDLTYLEIRDDNADECLDLAKGHRILLPIQVAHIKKSIDKTDNYSRDFFTDEYSWYDVQTL